jgi:hypothetical protein
MLLALCRHQITHLTLRLIPSLMPSCSNAPVPSHTQDGFTRCPFLQKLLLDADHLHFLATPSYSPHAVRDAGAKAHLDWHLACACALNRRCYQLSVRAPSCVSAPRNAVVHMQQAHLDGVLCDAVPSNCVKTVACAVSARVGAYRSWRPFLDAFWKHYKPQEACPAIHP